MSAMPQEQPRQTRGTVVPMPPRSPQPQDNRRTPAPPGQDADAPEEPGYGHGV
jgi:hypothetical protein